MLDLFFMLFGFIPLICGANFLVDGSSSLANKFNIPNIVIGLTIVAFGTSSPELIVNIFSSINQSPDITIGNVIGSNIFNIAFILGITSIIRGINVKTNTTWKEIPLTFLSTILAMVMMNDIAIDRKRISELSRIDGIVLLLFFIIFLSYIFSIMKSGEFEEKIDVKKYSARKSITFIIFGLVMLIIGGRIIVLFGINFARYLGISERIIGLTVIALGTSLPELTTSISAALKNNVDIAIGNITGSNIFNILFILGLSAVIYPIPLREGVNSDILFSLFLSFILFLFVFTGRGRKIERWEGVVLITSYIVYLIHLIA